MSSFNFFIVGQTIQYSMILIDTALHVICVNLLQMIQLFVRTVESILHVIRVLRPFWHCYAHQETAANDSQLAASFINIEMPKRSVNTSACYFYCHITRNRDNCGSFILVFLDTVVYVPSVLWCCRLGVEKSVWPVKTEWWGVGVVICLERGAVCLHMVHPKTPTSLASLKSRLVLPFWYRHTQAVPEKRPLNGFGNSRCDGWWNAVVLCLVVWSLPRRRIVLRRFHWKSLRRCRKTNHDCGTRKLMHWLPTLSCIYHQTGEH